MSWNTHIPKFRRFVLQNFPFIEQDFDALTDYELICKVIEYLNTVITSQNEVVAEVGRFETDVNNEIDTFETNITNNFNNLEGLFNDLKSFVENYFDNLDVQEEINNKLEQMTEDGTLQEIVANYLNSKALFGFDTVADMKAATNLIDGSYARTLGYYDINDGGSATYKISSTLPATYHEVLNNGLYATLVVNSSTNILHFGAKSDGSEDISNSYNAMLTQLGHIVIPKGTYRLDNPITITTSYDIHCSGTIDYKGNNYAFILQKANNCTYEIERINSTSGGAFDISSTDAVSFMNIKLNRAYVSREVFNLNANNGIVTLLNLEGVRWSSEDSSPIVMYQDTTTLSSAFLSEINIFNVDLLSKNQRPAIRATCDHPTKSINFNLDNVDLENSWGIHTYKRIFSIGMYNCRLGEINYKQGWLTFNDYCPKMTIVGTGDIDPAYITYNNVGTSYQYEQGILVLTNVVDSVSRATYNGAIITKNQMIPFARRWIYKSITSDIDTTTDTVTLPTPQPSGNLYNNFSFAYSNNLTINVPDNFADEFILSTQSAITITVHRGTYTTSFTNVPGTVYKVIFFGTGLKVQALS